MSDPDFYSYPVLSIAPLDEHRETLGPATGVLIRAGGQYFLATNYHVVTGCHPYTGRLQMRSRPAYLAIQHRKPSTEYPFPELATVEENLYSEGNPRWIEPENRFLEDKQINIELAVDLVLLPLENINLIKFPPLEWRRKIAFHLPVTEQVSIIGYPFSKCSFGHFPIWLNGTVASDFAGLTESKFFLVDCRTRPANSGSLVIHRSRGASWEKPGGIIGNNGQTATYVMGIYSGRIDTQSDIGFVWQWQLIEELLTKAISRERQDWGENNVL